jgi:aspartate 1-decarboxylase
MYIRVLKSKVHRATVTHADVNYEGSVTIDRDIMKAAGLYENEEVHIWNVTNGQRLTTYVMAPAASGSGIVCINGAAAHRVNVGDLVIITSFCAIQTKDVRRHKPTKVIVDAANQIRVVKHK